MKKFLQEFKAFALRGNVLDLAVGVMIGGAFGKIVSSLVNDIFMPIIGLVLGGANVSGASFTVGAATLNYGMFLQTVIDFLLMALCIFLFLKIVAKLTPKKKEEAPTPVQRLCDYCKQPIHVEATRCPHCTSQLK